MPSQRYRRRFTGRRRRRSITAPNRTIPTVISQSDRLLQAPGPSTINARKVAQKRAQEEASNTKAKELLRRQQRLIQLAKMPAGRGAAEYERILKGGSLEETSAEKKIRQRQSQLAAMPHSQGKITEQNKLAMEGHKRKIKAMQKAQAASGVAQLEAEAKKRIAPPPILQKKLGKKPQPN